MFRGNNNSHWRRSGFFIVDFELISHFYLAFLLLLWTNKCQLGKYWQLTLNTFRTLYTFIVDFEQAIPWWEIDLHHSTTSSYEAGYFIFRNLFWHLFESFISFFKALVLTFSKCAGTLESYGWNSSEEFQKYLE